MVITVKAVTFLSQDSQTEIVQEWHLLISKRSLCNRLVSTDEPDRHFIPHGGRVCTECINHLLRLVDLNRIGVSNAP